MNVIFDYMCSACGQLVSPIVDDAAEACPLCGAVDEGFEQLASTMSAEAIVARLRSLKGKSLGLDAQYKLVLDTLRKEQERAEKRYNTIMAWARPILVAYFNAHRPAKKKSIVLAGTTIGFKSIGGGYALAEQGLAKGDPKDLVSLHPALQWAVKNRPDLVKNEISLKWSELKKALGEMKTEEVVELPGISTVDPQEEFFVRD